MEKGGRRTQHVAGNEKKRQGGRKEPTVTARGREGSARRLLPSRRPFPAAGAALIVPGLPRNFPAQALAASPGPAMATRVRASSGRGSEGASGRGSSQNPLLSPPARPPARSPWRPPPRGPGLRWGYLLSSQSRRLPARDQPLGFGEAAPRREDDGEKTLAREGLGLPERAFEAANAGSHAGADVLARRSGGGTDTRGRARSSRDQGGPRGAGFRRHGGAWPRAAITPAPANMEGGPGAVAGRERGAPGCGAAAATLRELLPDGKASRYGRIVLRGRQAVLSQQAPGADPTRRLAASFPSWA